MTDHTLDEALHRLRDTGPERDGWLSNHGPMAAETLIRHGHGESVHRWLDDYRPRLEQVPRGIAAIRPQEWRDPLGDPVRTGDWLTFFARETTLAPWRDVLVTWWPRLLPGIAAGATHGVIRVGHAVRALLEEETPERVGELGRGLAYWAARWQPLAPAGKGPYRASDPRTALDAVPRVPDQRFGVRNRLSQLATMPDWAETAGAVPAVTSPAASDRLRAIVAAAVRRHLHFGYGSPIMLVHAATAPAAVARVLPALPPSMAGASVAAAWAATAAITAAYSPAEPDPRTAAIRSAPSDGTSTSSGIATASPEPAALLERSGSSARPPARSSAWPSARPPTRSSARSSARPAADVFARAAGSGDAHAIKFADAAVETWSVAGDPGLLAAAERATELIMEQ
ncbi:questin oxidase family protein [Actinoplanes rectilineatus]|uniref:questin oxidase family protein n=1 Tax=Actinoplanes rectilineatus TaxID=113571 RepID=UPI0005F2D2B6|nr:questin oxidase family protein [Actinoplanes rectilineatus]